MLLLDDFVEEEKRAENAKDVKTRQTCRYQNGDVPRTTTSDDRKRDRGWRDGSRKRQKRETTELNKLEKHLSGQLMLLSRPLILPSPDFRRQIKALVPPGTVNTFFDAPA